MMKNLLLLAALLLLSLNPAHAQDKAATSSPEDNAPKVTVRLVPEFSHIRPGQSLNLAIEQTIANGWHIYWKNPGDSGDPTRITWTLPKEITASEPIWPTPEAYNYGPLVNYGYKTRSILINPITASAKLSGKSVTISAHLEWLACREICIPEQTDIALIIPVAGAETKISATDPALFRTARSHVPTPADWQSRLEEQDQNLLINFQPDEQDLATLKKAAKITFFPSDWGVIVGNAPQQIELRDHNLELKLQRDTRPLSALTSFGGVLRLENKKHELVTAYTVTIPVTPLSAEAAAQGANQPTWMQALLLALLGGIILNLMPCVFPILSMKALSLIKMSAKEQRHATIHGLVYTLGIMTSFLIVAIILIGLQSAGEKIGWGFQFQNPVVVLLLAYLLYGMGLNLSGFLEFRGHFFSNVGHKLTERHGYLGTYFTGVLATVVASPCTAPFMGPAMGFALTQPESIALTIFMALGLGLALPYVLLCILPPLRKMLPRPGAWMETFRGFMAFPLYAFTAWLVWIYTMQISGDYALLTAFAGLFLLTLSIWVSRHIPHKEPGRTAVKALAIAFFVFALIIAGYSNVKPIAPPGHLTESSETKHTDEYIAYSPDNLTTALAGKEAVFVNMTAAWCLTCKVNERVALSNSSVQTAFKAKKVIYILGDWTNRNPEISDYLKKFGRNGVPLYVYYGPRDEQGHRPAPRVLPQILTPGLLEDVL